MRKNESISIISNKEKVARIYFEVILEKNIITLDIIDISVKEEFQKRGIQNYLFKEVLRLNPKIKQISTSLLEKNLDILMSTLLLLLKKKYHLKDISPSNWETEYGPIHHWFSKTLSKKERNSFLIESFKFTPAYKSRKHIGFSRISINDIYFNYIPGVELYSVRFLTLNDHAK